MPTPDMTIIQDPERLEMLGRLGLLDASTDPAFDRLTRLATMMLKMPVSLVTLVDSSRQFFKSSVGLPEPWATLRETPLKYSFCKHVVATGEPLIIDDATRHPLVQDNPAVERLQLISYAGMPLTISNGMTLGSFCVVDRNPHAWTDEELIMLADLSGAVLTEIELRGQLIERERIEKELRANEMRLNAVLSSAPVVLYTLDTKGTVTLSRGKALNAVGIEQDSTVGQSAFERNANNQTTQAAIRRALDGEAFSVVVEANQHWYSVNYSPLIDAAGELEGTIGVATDISEVIEIQHALEGSLERISELEQLKSDMIRVAAHDLKNPLSGVLGFAKLLLETPLTDDQKSMTKELLDGARRMFRIINDILSLERIEAMAQAAKYQRIDLRELATRAYIENEAAARRKNQIYLNFLPEESIYINSDESQLLEAASNLINNAIKYTPEGGRVVVQVRTDDQGKAIFEVQDNGYGIVKEQQSNLFKPFFRAKSKETLEIEGTGLGLNLVKNIIERHGGAMHVESEYGVGSTFGFELNQAN